MNTKEIKYRLRMPFLKEKGLNKEELKQRTGANDLAVTKWSAGAVIPPLETLLMLADITNTNISYLLMLTDIAAPISSREIQFRLKELRLQNGLTQEELAIKAGINAKSVGNYEMDESLIYGRKALRMLITIAETLSVSFDYLLGLTERKSWEAADDSPLFKVKPGSAIHIRNNNFDEECMVADNGREIILSDGEIVSFLDPRLYDVVITIS